VPASQAIVGCKVKVKSIVCAWAEIESQKVWQTNLRALSNRFCRLHFVSAQKSREQQHDHPWGLLVLKCVQVTPFDKCQDIDHMLSVRVSAEHLPELCLLIASVRIHLE